MEGAPQTTPEGEERVADVIGAIEELEADVTAVDEAMEDPEADLPMAA